jgi:hypothetical protein
VAKRNAFEIPISLAAIEVTSEVPAATIRDLAALATELVPTHDQAEASYRWLETLTRLEAGGKLKHAALPEGVQKTLRGVPWAYKAIGKELQEHDATYFNSRGDHGGWTQLKMIIDWTFFLHTWQLLDQKATRSEVVVRAVSVLDPGDSLLTLSEIQALSRTT